MEQLISLAFTCLIIGFGVGLIFELFSFSLNLVFNIITSSKNA